MIIISVIAMLRVISMRNFHEQLHKCIFLKFNKVIFLEMLQFNYV